MPYPIRFSLVAKKQFTRLKDATLKERLASALEHVAENPLAGKPLHGELKGDHSFRVGDYRIIYHFYKKEKYIGIVHIAHRRSAHQ